MNERSFIELGILNRSVKMETEEAGAAGRMHPRKIEIVTAAVTCFLERGYHQTGIRDIARQAGVSLGNLYNHFSGKEAVLAFIAELEGRELAAFVDMLSDPEEPYAALERFIWAYAAYAARPENALLGLELMAEALRNPTISQVFDGNRHQLVAALMGCLERGVSTGRFRRLDDTRALALMILDTLEGQGLRELDRKTPDPDAVRTLCAVLTTGLLARDQSPPPVPCNTPCSSA